MHYLKVQAVIPSHQKVVQFTKSIVRLPHLTALIDRTVMLSYSNHLTVSGELRRHVLIRVVYVYLSGNLLAEIAIMFLQL